MRVNHPWVGAFALSLTILAVSVTVAQAQEGPDWFGRSTNKAAMKELETGNKFYIQRDFERAIKFYKSGQMIDNAPIFLYNIGQSYRQLGDYEQAIWYYERWLAAYKPAADSKARKAVERWLKQMRAELEEQARKEPPLDAAPNGDSAPSSDGNEPEHTASIPSSGAHAAPWYEDRLGWSLAGVGVTSVVVGAGFLGRASSLQADANREVDALKRWGLRDDADRRRVVGYVAVGLGAALTAGAAIALAVHPRSESKESRRSAWLEIGAGSFAIGGRF